ncbi:MAG: hypothetical protein NDJ89_17520 [Oligoflexia bacterium]|nr:hypothetical protein [Oligoflexia bacterium]
MRKPLFSLSAGGLVWLSAVLLAGCAASGTVDITPKESAGAPQAGTDAQPVVGPGENTGLPGTPGVGLGRGSSESAASSILLVSGGDEVTGIHLFTLSSSARDSVPIRFSSDGVEIRDAAPYPRNDLAVAIGYEKFGFGSSLLLLNLNQGSSYRLYLSRDGSLSDPVPSWDGRWIAFRELDRETNRWQMRLLDVESEVPVEVPAPVDARGRRIADFEDGVPSFSPDVRSLHFERRIQGRSTILSFELPGGTDAGEAGKPVGLASAVTLAVAQAPEESIRDFQWRNGMSLAHYVLQTAPKGNLSEKSVLMLRSGEEEFPVSSPEEKAYEASWSPDGKRILYWSNSKKGQFLKAYSVATRSTEVLAAFVAPARGPRGSDRYRKVCPLWSPDMREVYFTGSTGTWSGIFKVALDDGKVSRLTDSSIPPSYFCPKLVRSQ